MSASPARGEVWMADLDPVRGHEQGRRRPVLIVSHDRLNRGPAALVVAVPITGTARGIATHVPVTPPEGGLVQPSVIMTEQVRSISRDRLGRRLGPLDPDTMHRVEQALRIILDL